MFTRNFTEVIAWQKAHAFVLSVYKVVKTFPDTERYALASQFTRAAVSIPANIAEGYKRIGKSDKLRFMNIAQGSLEECRYYVILAKDLQYITLQDYVALSGNIEETSKFLNLYAKGIEKNSYEKGDALR